jgi:accessory gene regulator protein AgrB
MKTATTEPPKSQAVKRTYLYLRIGMIGAVVLLGVSVGYERSQVSCFQTSISAYYYTPVRAMFVGSLLAVGLALIIYKGRTIWEDASLNFAGMLAPVVAVAPTMDVGTCWSTPPTSPPVLSDGSLAEWVVTGIENNFTALLITGGIGLLVSYGIATWLKRSGLAPLRAGLQDALDLAPVRRETRETNASLVVTGLVLLLGLWLFRTWSEFNTRAHGYAAILMFVFLGLAIIAHAWADRQEGEREKRFSRLYMAIAGAMLLGGIIIWVTRIADEHTVLVVEAYEIALFASYWIAQTVGHWREEDAVVPVESQAGVERGGERPLAPRGEGA